MLPFQWTVKEWIENQNSISRMNERVKYEINGFASVCRPLTGPLKYSIKFCMHTIFNLNLLYRYILNWRDYYIQSHIGVSADKTYNMKIVYENMKKHISASLLFNYKTLLNFPRQYFCFEIPWAQKKFLYGRIHNTVPEF